MRSLLLLLVVFQLAAVAHSNGIKCYEGYVGAISIEDGFTMCAIAIEMETNEKRYYGWALDTHIFNETRKIDFSLGDCFVMFEFDTVFTYCYCRRELCNKPLRTHPVLDYLGKDFNK